MHTLVQHRSAGILSGYIASHTHSDSRLAIVVFYISLLLLTAGCSITKPAVGYDVHSDEVYKGTVTMSMVDGTGTISVIGNKSGNRADGQAAWKWGLGNPHGGTLSMDTQDGRRVSGKWVGTTSTSGYGTATDQFGNLYTLVFGLEPSEEQAWVEAQRQATAKTSNKGVSGISQKPYWASEFHSGEASRSELLFREWQMALGEETYNAIHSGLSEPGAIAHYAITATAVRESNLKAMMVHEGVSSDRADAFISGYKERLPQDILWLLQER
ncbi:MAG: hypothetical protein GC162_20255 [Planctomycetes bacterium]|nr:hypothetical protein [Planctomycetota bacterium]